MRDIKNAAGGEGPHAALVSAASVSFVSLVLRARYDNLIKLLMYRALPTSRRLIISAPVAPSSLLGSLHKPRLVRPSSGRWSKASTSLDLMLGAHTLPARYRVEF